MGEYSENSPQIGPPGNDPDSCLCVGGRFGWVLWDGIAAALPWVLALTPPPSAYIGLALFFGGFNAPSVAEGVLVLTMVGLGLTLPLWLIIVKPGWRSSWQLRLQNNPRTARTQVVFQFVGVGLMLIVGTAFLLVQDFHRPLLELYKHF